MDRRVLSIIALSFFTSAGAPDSCADPALLQRVVERAPKEDPAERAERIAHELFALKATALKTPVPLPHKEVLTFSPERALPAAYEVNVLRGQELRVTIAGAEKRSIADVRIGVFAHDGMKLRRIAVAEGGAPLETRIFWTGPHQIVVEPGSNVAGQLALEVHAGASLLFPVAAKDSRAIKSFFGDRRGGGSRSHQGVDIFAPKGTEVLAAVDGYVARVGYSGLGGKVVWLADADSSRFFYYAHLDAFAAVEGSEVKAGDVLGYVGNTGNARTTPPHLHFGVYAPRAVDPMPYVHEPKVSPKKISAKLHLIGSTVVTSGKKSVLLASPEGSATPLRTVERDTPVTILGASALFYRVLLEDGTIAWIRHDRLRVSKRAA